MDLCGEVVGEVHGHDQDDVVGQDLEVGGIHPELVGMQLTEAAQRRGEIIDVFHGHAHGSHDHPSVFLHLRVLRSQISPPL
ncbi:hypothetical protein ABE07_00005 [Bacillus thuringiensis]|nr:hypothetical protein [Bacillus thuringiensis]